MPYRLAALSLGAVLAVLSVLCGRTPLPAGPAEPEAKGPAIYALVYVGLGKNDPDNAKRISAAVQDLRNRVTHAIRVPKIKALPIVKDKDPTVKSSTSIVQGKEQTLTWIERDEWAKSKARAASIGGTAVIRVWFTDGTPQEQVAIVNATAEAYIKVLLERRPGEDDPLEYLKRRKAAFKEMRDRAGLPVTEEDERAFRRHEESIRNQPYIIEWAKLPEKP